MLFFIYVKVLLFGVDAHIKLTECQAEYFRSQPGNEDVVFESDGIPCQIERKRRGLISFDYRWNDIVQDGNLQMKSVDNNKPRFQENISYLTSSKMVTRITNTAV